MHAALSATVLMPVFNGARYLPRAVDSILEQTCRDFEFLIIDDGSTDRSVRLLDDYARRDARIRLIRRENRGLVASLNEGLALARGEIILRMDADDISLPERLRLQLDYLARAPEVVCLGGAFALIDVRGRYLTTLRPGLTDAELQALALAGHTPFCHPSAAIRRAASARVGGYRQEAYPAEDLDLWLRLGEIGQLANLPELIVAYRIHADSISGRARELQRDRARWACAQAWARRGISGCFEADADWRPGPDRASRHHFVMRHGWWAFNNGQSRTAAVYGLKAVGLDPRRMDGWKLLACALLKQPRSASTASHLRTTG